jgi:hypothetical protein
MEKHEEIYIPCQDEDLDFIGIVKSSVPDFPIKCKQDVIVLTIEELREVWDKGYVRGCEECNEKNGRPYSETPNFKEYLSSKGIEI